MKFLFKNGKSTSKEATLLESLQQILTMAHQKETMPLRSILVPLTGRGYALLLILLSLPFCFFLNIPGFSTPFGIILAFIGFRIAFAKRPWWPKWIIERNIPSKKLIPLAAKALSVVNSLKKILHPRMSYLAHDPYVRRFNGLLIIILAILLSLPLPIPFTNTLAAIPIFLFGLGMLEDDGYAILLGYAVSVICFASFVLMFLFGKAILFSVFF